MICNSKTVFAEITLNKEEFDPSDNLEVSINFSNWFQIVLSIKVSLIVQVQLRSVHQGIVV
jgi:hypothetical protein